MMERLISRILCPIDFSQPAMEAFQYAQELAIGTQASLLVCHAFQLPASWELGDQTEPADEEIKEKMASLQAALPIEKFLHAGAAGKVICWLADDQRCDMIVMGTHGRTGLRHLLFGRVAEYVLQHAHCPVMTIRKRPSREADHPEPVVVPLPAPRFM